MALVSFRMLEYCDSRSSAASRPADGESEGGRKELLTFFRAGGEREGGRSVLAGRKLGATW